MSEGYHIYKAWSLKQAESASLPSYAMPGDRLGIMPSRSAPDGIRCIICGMDTIVWGELEVDDALAWVPGRHNYTASCFNPRCPSNRSDKA